MTTSDQTRLRLRYDQNFRFAKVNELAQAAPGNILDTQTGDSFEIGIDLTRGDHQLILSIYRLDLEDEIEFDPDAGMFGENVNLDDTRRDGLTVSLYSQLSMAFRRQGNLRRRRRDRKPARRLSHKRSIFDLPGISLQFTEIRPGRQRQRFRQARIDHRLQRGYRLSIQGLGCKLPYQ
jgi:outer membrane cobalamin receptor